MIEVIVNVIKPRAFINGGPQLSANQVTTCKVESIWKELRLEEREQWFSPPCPNKDFNKNCLSNCVLSQELLFIIAKKVEFGFKESRISLEKCFNVKHAMVGIESYLWKVNFVELYDLVYARNDRLFLHLRSSNDFC